VYKQKDGERIHDTSIGHIAAKSVAGRLNFNILQFANKHNFDLIAGNFYNAKFSVYVFRMMFKLICGC
jgi:hypothetical protein